MPSILHPPHACPRPSSPRGQNDSPSRIKEIPPTIYRRSSRRPPQPTRKKVPRFTSSSPPRPSSAPPSAAPRSRPSCRRRPSSPPTGASCWCHPRPRCLPGSSLLLVSLGCFCWGFKGDGGDGIGQMAGRRGGGGGCRGGERSIGREKGGDVPSTGKSSNSSSSPMAAGFFSSTLGSSVFCAAGALGSDDAIAVSRLRSFRVFCGSFEVGVRRSVVVVEFL